MKMILTMIKSLKILMICVFVLSISGAHAHEGIVQTGDNLQVAIPIFAGTLSLIKGDYEGTGEWLQGVLWTAVATHTLKFAVSEERPNKMDDHSFPSGHTSAAFQGAAFLQMRYGWQYGLPAYAGASLVGYSRVRGKYHYWHDVVVGAALAVGVQYSISGIGHHRNKVVVAPMMSGDHVGVYASMTY